VTTEEDGETGISGISVFSDRKLAHDCALYGRVPLLMPDHRSTEQAAYYASTEPKRRQPPPGKKEAILQEGRARPVTSFGPSARALDFIVKFLPGWPRFLPRPPNSTSLTRGYLSDLYNPGW
jgi:hypothetical protein